MSASAQRRPLLWAALAVGAIFVALVLSFLETMIPLPVAVPGIKLGAVNLCESNARLKSPLAYSGGEQRRLALTGMLAPCARLRRSSPLWLFSTCSFVQKASCCLCAARSV